MGAISNRRRLQRLPGQALGVRQFMQNRRRFHLGNLTAAENQSNRILPQRCERLWILTWSGVA
jgi:hypothetical protein